MPSPMAKLQPGGARDIFPTQSVHGFLHGIERRVFWFFAARKVSNEQRTSRTKTEVALLQEKLLQVAVDYIGPFANLLENAQGVVETLRPWSSAKMRQQTQVTSYQPSFSNQLWRACFQILCEWARALLTKKHPKHPLLIRHIKFGKLREHGPVNRSKAKCCGPGKQHRHVRKADDWHWVFAHGVLIKKRGHPRTAVAPSCGPNTAHIRVSQRSIKFSGAALVVSCQESISARDVIRDSDSKMPFQKRQGRREALRRKGPRWRNDGNRISFAQGRRWGQTRRLGLTHAATIAAQRIGPRGTSPIPNAHRCELGVRNTG